MLNVLLKHLVYNAGITAFFDALIKSFNINAYGNWLSNPDAFKRDHKIGSVIYADFEFWILDRFLDDKKNRVIRIKDYPVVVTNYIPLGVNNKLLLYGETDLLIIGELIFVYDVILEKWTHQGGIFSKYFNKDIMNKLGFDL